MNFDCRRPKQTLLDLALLVAAAGAVYLPVPVLLGGQVLYGWDYAMLHVRRLAFAREALAGPGHTLPGWSPRELLGAPFAANLQSFPWIPAHWILLAFSPERAYTVAVVLSAALSAVLTYAYCRQLRLARLASFTAAWTFACAGFFAARVMVGHLSILETYPALPLLLLLVERAVDPELAGKRAFTLLLLALACASLAVAGHPQLPAYAIAAAVLYAGWIARGRLRFPVIGTCLLGVGLSAAVWWPMFLLIRRSSRVLPLATAANDIIVPYRRLLALFAPGIDGWPAGVGGAAGHPFAGYSHPGYFWDTVGYAGLLPWAAAAALALRCASQKRWPAARWTFLALLGCGAMAAALPVLTPLRQLVPGTLLRSPSRLLYLSTFCLAMALGATVDAFLRRKPSRGRALPVYLVAGACLALHGFDLGGFARRFLLPTGQHEVEMPAIESVIARGPAGERIAVSRVLPLALSARYDDAGSFDSIFLADPYRALLALSGAAPRLNEEVMDASLWPVPALRAASVNFVVTAAARDNLELVQEVSGVRLYRVSDPAPRAGFVPAALARFRPREAIFQELARAGLPSAGPMWLPSEQESLLRGIPLAPAPAPSAPAPAVAYSRPASGRIVLRVVANQPGFLSLVEAWDPGWRAEVDGLPAPIVEANGFGMAIPVAAGSHTAILGYRTPGRLAGKAISLGSVMLLGWLIWRLASQSQKRAAHAV